MKKILFFILFIFITIFLVGTVSASDWDNVLDYSENDLKVTISNSFLLLFKTSEIGTVELKSHLSIDYIKRVGAGNQVVMWYDFDFLGLYDNGLGKVEFINVRNGKKIDRDYSFVYWGEKERDVYGDGKCLFNVNGTKDCEQIVIGKETYNGWLPYNSKDIPKGKIRIGLIVNTKIGDHTDGIWTIVGKEISRHAEWDVSTAVFVQAESVVTNSPAPKGLFFKNDGTKMYIGDVGDGVDEYALGTAWDVSSASYTDNFDTSGQDPNPTGLFFKDDGTKMYAIGQDQDEINEYDLSTPWDVSTGSAVGVFDISNNETDSQAVHFKDDGTKMYMTGIISDKIHEYDLSTPWNISTAIFFQSFSVVAQETFPQGLFFNIDGSQMFITGYLSDAFVQYDLSTPWNISSASYTQSFSVAGQEGDAVDLFFNASGNKAYLLGYGGKDVNEYNLTTIITGIEVTLNSPVNEFNTTNPTIEFNCTASDDTSVVNVSLYINGTIDQTNSSGLNNTNYLFTSTVSSTGSYNWSCDAYDDENNWIIADARNFTYSNDITVTLNSPVNAFNSSSISITFNGTVSDDTSVANVSLYINGTIDQTNSSGLNNTNYLFTKNLIDGDHNWTYEACDSTSCLTATTRNLTIDTTTPIVNDAQNITDLVVYSLPVNSTWNYTVTDLHIDKCYYNTSDSATLNFITCNSSIDTIWTTGGNKTIQYFANDTFGWETSKLTYVYVYSITYIQTDNPDPVGEGTNVIFDLNISLSSIPTTIATLRLNDTYYIPDTTTSTSDYYYFQKTVLIPDGYGNTTGFPQLWLWNYTIEGVTTNASTSNTNVTVYEVAIDNCSTYGEVILNLTLNDEENNNQVNGSLGSNIEIDLLLTSILNSSLTWTYSNTWINDSNVAVCIPSNVLNNSEYYIDFDIGFDSTDRVWEFYFLDQEVLNSTKVFDAYTDYTISLMDLLTTDSTSFLFNFFDEDGLAVEGSMVHVFRKYIGEGLFREVERAKADDNGDTILHLVEEDVIYYFVITLNGVTLFTSNTYTALCQATPCTIQLEASGDFVEFPTDYDLIAGGGYEITSDAGDRVVNLTYSLNHTADMNFTLYRYESDGSYSVIDTDADTGSSGVISLTAPQVAGNVSFFASVQKDDVFISSQWINFESNASQFFGTTMALLLAGLIILTLGLVAVSEGAGAIIFVILGVIFSGALGLLYTQLSTGINIVIYLVLVGGLIVWKLNRRRS